MKKFLSIFCLCLLFQSPIFAILPPLYQGIKEMTAILQDPQLGQLLHSGEVIMSIQKTDSGYTVVTNQHQLPIKVNYRQERRIGPQQFTLSFDAPTAID